MKKQPVVTDPRTLARAVDELASTHPEIAKIVSLYGSPPLWGREPGFASLVYTILEQQVSLASARSAYQKLKKVTGDPTPAAFMKLDDGELREIGFSRQKTEYCRILAGLILDGSLELDALKKMSDERVRDELMSIKGIGRWTADVYLLHSLGRPDIWPAGDLALRIGYQEVTGLAERPTEKELDRIGATYSPWRSAAARLFWLSYLSRRKLELV